MFTINQDKSGSGATKPVDGRVDISDSLYLSVKLSTRYPNRLDVSMKTICVCL